jgi:Asp-tRNA(Asn)/Glu-tRNA(Gln) amidotransferase A subunit family amidase
MSRYCSSVLEGGERATEKVEEASLVKAIREAGGVVFCKTNVPCVSSETPFVGMRRICR